MTHRQTVQPWPGTAEAPAGAIWRKSSYSGTQGNCVEVVTNLLGLVVVRDSKDPDGPKLMVRADKWRGLLCNIKGGLDDWC